MKISDSIAFKIERLPKGYIFTYADFSTSVGTKEAIIKALSRLAKSGKIAKLAKGRFYKPERTPFGNLSPDLMQVVKDLLEENGKIVGYLTGFSVYNKLGLTTQVSNVIQIGKRQIRPSFKRERYTISFVLQKNNITKENIPLLQILDSMRYIKKIPDAILSDSCKRLLSIVKDLSRKDRSTMVRLALKYPPMVRALLGAFLDQLKAGVVSEPLYRSLNPVTRYKLSGIASVLDKTEKWMLYETSRKQNSF